MTGFKVTLDEVANYAGACNSTASEIQGQLRSTSRRLSLGSGCDPVDGSGEGERSFEVFRKSV